MSRRGLSGLVGLDITTRVLDRALTWWWKRGACWGPQLLLCGPALIHQGPGEPGPGYNRDMEARKDPWSHLGQITLVFKKSVSHPGLQVPLESRAISPGVHVVSSVINSSVVNVNWR